MHNAVHIMPNTARIRPAMRGYARARALRRDQRLALDARADVALVLSGMIEMQHPHLPTTQLIGPILILASDLNAACVKALNDVRVLNLSLGMCRPLLRNDMPFRTTFHRAMSARIRTLAAQAQQARAQDMD